MKALSLRAVLFLMIECFLFFPCLHAQDELLIIEDKNEEKPAPRGKEVPSESISQEAPSDSTFQNYYELWRQFELNLQLGKVDDRIINELIRQKNRNGIPKITEFALSAIRFGQVRMAQNKVDDALKLFRAASILDPSLSLAYYSEARSLVAQSWSNVPGAIRVSIRGMFAPLSTWNGKLYLYVKYGFILSAVLIVLGVAFGLILLTKYYRLFRHDLGERFTSLTSPAINLLALLILFLPVLFFAGPIWLAPFWMMLFWKYGRVSEKIFGAVFLAVFVLAYPLYRYVVEVSKASLDPSIAPYVQVFSEGPTPRTLDNFQQYTVDHPEDSDGTILLAHLYRARQNLTQAIRTLQKHILDHPNDARSFNNLAHVYFVQGEIDIALRMVQKASDLDSSNAVYPYNLSILQRAKFNFSDAEELLSGARRLNAPLIRKFEESPYATMIDSIPDEEMLWVKIQKKSGEVVDHLINPFSGFSLLLLVLSLSTLSGNKKKEHARECIKCGRPFCKKCQPAVKEFRFCTQCMHIFVKKDGVSPASRRDKLHEIEDYSHRQEIFLRIGSLLLPGFASMYKNRILFGMFLLLFWFVFLVLLLYNWIFSGSSFYESDSSGYVLSPLFLLLLGLIYVVGNLSTLKKIRS